MRFVGLIVDPKLCDLRLEVCECTHDWPVDEAYGIVLQARRSSNGAPAQLAEKHRLRQMRNKIEGVNRARGEVLETVHHRFVACRKKYLAPARFESLRRRFHECVRMLNGLERKIELQISPITQRFPPLT